MTRMVSGMESSRQVESNSREPEDASRLYVVRGRAMFPLIPHRSLLGLARRDPGHVQSGDIVALDLGDGRLRIQRVLRTDQVAGQLYCRADCRGRGSWYDAERYAGSVLWRCRHGRKRMLAIRSRPLTKAIFLGLCRLEARCAGAPDDGTSLPRTWARRGAAALTLPCSALRRFLGNSLYPDETVPPGDLETPYLLHSLQAVVLPGGDPLRPPPEGLDWDVCLDLALAHRLGGLLLPAWSGLPEGTRPPARALEALKEAVRSGEALWREALEVLRPLTRTFHERDIPYVLLKGPGLSACYDNGPRERSFADLDIVVPVARLDAALAALAEAGFQEEGGIRNRQLMRRMHFHLVLTPPVPLQLPVELHWNLVDRANLYRIDMTRVFADARDIRIGDTKVRALGLTDDLIYMCIHIAKHGVLNHLAADGRVGGDWVARGCSGNRLIWFVDLYRFLSQAGADTEPGSFWRRTADWNTAGEVRNCLTLLQGILPSESARVLLAAFPAGGQPEPVRKGGGLFLTRGDTRLLRWAMNVSPILTLRPVRLFELARLLFPCPSALRRYYGVRSWPGTLYRYAIHPAHMLRKMLGRD